MKAISKLKDEARAHEIREEWDEAISLYERVLQTRQDEDEGDRELSLFNRVGDLHLRTGRADRAVDYYVQAADLYGQAGLFNNAIALCSKALRYVPDRTELYRKLGRLCGEQGFLSDARRWFLEYAERQLRAGQLDESFAALEEFAGLSQDPEIWAKLGHQLVVHDRKEEAASAFRRSRALYEAAGEEEALAGVVARLEELAAEGYVGEAESWPPAGEEQDDRSPDAVAPAGDVEGRDDDGARDTEEDLGVQPTVLADPPASEAEVEALAGLQTFQPEAEIDDDHPADADPESHPALGASEAGAEGPDEDPDFAGEPLPLLGAESESVVPEFGALIAEETSPPEDVAVEGFDFFHVDDDDEAAGIPSPTAEAGLEAVSAVDLEATLGTAEAMAARGDGAGAADLLNHLAGRLVEGGREDDILTVAEAMRRLAPDDRRAYQLLVEHAYRSGEDGRLVDAYLAQAEHLAASGDPDKARGLFERVLAMDAANPRARAGIATPVEPDPAEEGDYVDLAALIFEEEPGDSTRFVVPEDEPTGDEERDFNDMLAQFKAKVSEHIADDDTASHYDLGLVYKDMGLLDEAIAEFQTALRHGQERLKVYEELGHCFMLKERYTVAVKLLRQAITLPGSSDGELMGVHYLLGRCLEEAGRPDEARDAYEQVMSIDITFQDVAERLERL